MFCCFHSCWNGPSVEDGDLRLAALPLSRRKPAIVASVVLGEHDHLRLAETGGSFEHRALLSRYWRGRCSTGMTEGTSHG